MSPADIAREGQIRRLAKQMKHADCLRDRDEQRRLWEQMRKLALSRSPEQVLAMERTAGLERRHA